MRAANRIVSRFGVGRWAAIFLTVLALLGTTACGGKDEGASSSSENGGDSMEQMDSSTLDADDMEEEVSRETPGPRRTTACALTEEEVSEIIKDRVTSNVASGKWGIASTCSYSTATVPVAVELASAATADLSGDRMMEGFKEVSDLGDEAVWIPAVRTLAVVDKNKGKLLRIRIGVAASDEERLQMAAAIARLALTRL